VTLLERLRALYPEASGRSLKQWLEAGRVEVNGQPARDGRRAVAAGDTVALAARRAAPFPRGLSLVHEDDAILVVAKPSGLLSIATDRERDRTAYRLLWDYLAAKRQRPFIVHRLDRETSGLLVFAKSEETKRALQAQFEARNVERVYLALVEGGPPDQRGTLESTLAEDRMLRVRSAEKGRQAVTHYRVLRRRREGCLLELRLGTTRSACSSPRRAGRSSATSPTAAPGAASGGCACTPRGSASCIRRRGARSCSRARRPPTGYNPRVRGALP
jgi:23S rRNA pseudouridine1911/1915/1917 synthase